MNTLLLAVTSRLRHRRQPRVRTLRALPAVLVLLMAVPATSALAQEPPSTMTGEVLAAFDVGPARPVPPSQLCSGLGQFATICSTATDFVRDIEWTASCNADGSGRLDYHITGPATGPYPGTYDEVGTMAWGSEVVPTVPDNTFITAFNATFKIESPAGDISGTKALTDDSLSYRHDVFCDADPSLTQISFFIENAIYEATITTAAGSWRDEGVSALRGTFRQYPTGGEIHDDGNFIEYFRSQLTSPEPSGPATVTLSPASAVNNVGTQHTVTATVRNLGGLPVSGVDVDFTVAGSVNTTLSCTTDASGACSVTYTGPALPGADLIVGCADSDDDGARDPGEPCGEATKAWMLPTSTAGQVTGGGHVLNPTDNEEVAFGFNAQSDGIGPKGNCTVVDKAPTRNVKIKCLTVDALVQSGNAATFYGQAEVNGTVTNYRIDVTDNGEPGQGRDTFAIQTGSGYSAGGLLDNGNVQVHGN